MGRAEERKRNKKLKQKLNDRQFNALISDSNKEYVEREVEKRCDFIQKLFSEVLEDTMKKHGISSTKVLQILQDMELEMIRRRNNG